ncbi:NADH-quinone oxidoreductase subunit C [Ilumatobacter nonamiensis]|uniref:NADH-quinone oxidoreductase subunit C n=1 Tax=Ilumatobacter nonamiensis TaxID=467093 RepID=UPI00130E43A0|nr:NADH-quinone oxidoreductase subunit C [Ilumatobacter nonamiensis]
MSDTETTDDAAAETQALPGDGLREGIVDDLRARIGDALIEFEIDPNTDLTVRVATDAWAETAAALKLAGFSFFSFLSAIDWMPSPYGKGEDDPTVEKEPIDMTIKQGVCGGETRMQVFARLTDLDRHVGITIKADVADDHQVVDSWTGSYAGANWHERECHEMFGIGFNGHPDLRNMYLPGDFEGHPLKKDFPLLARMVKPWPGIVDVEPMPEKAEEIKDEPLPLTDEDGAIDVDATVEATGDDASPPDPDATTAVAAATGDEATHVGEADESDGEKADDES